MRLLCPCPFATQMFQLPSVTVTIIAATRTYRSLAEFAGGSTEMYYFLRSLSSPGSFLSMTRSTLEGLPENDNRVSKIRWNNPAPIVHSQNAISVDTSHLQYPTSQTSLSVGAQLSDKPPELSVGSDLESAVENHVPS